MSEERFLVHAAIEASATFERTAETLRFALQEAHIQAHGSAVEVCGFLTGHVVRPIAFCDTPETAALIVEALRAAAPRKGGVNDDRGSHGGE